MDAHELAPAGTPHAPLSGITVVDASRYLPGPFCSLQLAWLGADVTVIERAPAGDPMRSAPPIGETGVSLASQSLLRGKRSVMLDFDDDADRAQAVALAGSADVFIEGFRPGVADRVGLGYEALRAANPAIVYCSISGYGQTGPWAQVAGHDANYESVAGLLARSGTRDAPALPGVPLADLAGGAFAATAICAALVAARATGEGTHIDLSLTEAALAFQAHTLPAAGTPDAIRGGGLLTGGLACYGVYRCANDSFVSVAPIEPKFFATLCDRLGVPDLAAQQYDPAAQESVRAALTAAFITKPARDWHAELAMEDTCVCEVYEGTSFVTHPQHEARAALEPLYDEHDAWVPRSPFVFDGVRSDACQ